MFYFDDKLNLDFNSKTVSIVPYSLVNSVGAMSGVSEENLNIQTLQNLTDISIGLVGGGNF